jgi:hypothetical protein
MRKRNLGWVGLVLAVPLGLLAGYSSTTSNCNGKAVAATTGAGDSGITAVSRTAGSARSMTGADSVLMHHKSLSRA